MGLSQEEEDEVILESEKEAARRAFQALEREGSFPESSDSSSEERESYSGTCSCGTDFHGTESLFLQWDLLVG
jgi:hypothetical protein